MKLSDFDYHLPEELIARYPAEKRDASRMMILNRSAHTVEDKQFKDILSYMQEGDCLVLNKTKVIPARLFGVREGTGAAIEIFLLTRMQGVEEQWQVLAAPAKKVKVGENILFPNSTMKAHVLREGEAGERILEFNGDEPFEEFLNKRGHIPLPPYLKREDEASDKERYQTVYAEVTGAVAAPTAGLHFTDEILNEIKKKGVKIAEVVLHTGIGTFRPVEVENITEHVMHAERYEVSEEAAETINATKRKTGRIIAVGTTSVRTLETVANSDGTVRAETGSSSIFIYPPYQFRVPDAMLTNFHMPKSTLLMMLSAFAGREFIFEAYQHAVEERYRFYSYGDAMLIL